MVSNPDLPQKTLQIKQNDKFFTRLLSKETSMAQPSLRIYYGGHTGSVPFLWESQPGTPKFNFSQDSFLPPLTPPPSYYTNSNQKPIRKFSRSSSLKKLFLRMIFKKTIDQNSASTVVPSSSPSLSVSSSSSSWSSWNSSIFVPVNNFKERSRFSTPCSSFDSEMNESTTSNLCYDLSPPRRCYGR